MGGAWCEFYMRKLNNSKNAWQTLGTAAVAACGIKRNVCTPTGNRKKHSKRFDGKL